MEKEIKNKRALKRIAKEWAAAVLVNSETDAFDAEMRLSNEEQGYIVEEVIKIGIKIMGGNNPDSDLHCIVKKHLNP